VICLLAGEHQEHVTIVEYFTSPTGRTCALVTLDDTVLNGAIDLEGIVITHDHIH
jgi:hypothetical protein